MVELYNLLIIIRGKMLVNPMKACNASHRYTNGKEPVGIFRDGLIMFGIRTATD